MRVAFYAPMKAPDDPVPSGDRTVARALIAALETGGAVVEVASRQRAYARAPDPDTLASLAVSALGEAKRIVAAVEAGEQLRPDVWFTYHLYYKAPDMLGPKVAERLAIPYVAAEASYAPRRDRDAWAPWQAAALTAMRRARAIFCLTARDEPCLRQVLDEHTRFVDLPPFLDVAGRTVRAHPSAEHVEPVRLVTVAMMRDGAKARSYRYLADALSRVQSRNWRLDVIGDGAARGDIEPALRAASGHRVVFRGELAPSEVASALAEADVLVWPGFEEAFGMVYLEAQAHGLGVVALATAGVPEVVAHGETGLLAPPEASAQDYADLLDRVIEDRALRIRLGTAARERMARRHSLETASATLLATLRDVIGQGNTE